MAKKTISRCFACGEPSNTQIQRVSAPFYKRVICMNVACWRRWWGLVK